MTTEDETVYVLSASLSGGKIMYLQENISPEIGSRAGMKLSGAKIFKTEEEAQTFRVEEPAMAWQIQPTTRKKIFTARLLGL